MTGAQDRFSANWVTQVPLWISFFIETDNPMIEPNLLGSCDDFEVLINISYYCQSMSAIMIREHGKDPKL